MKNRRSEFLILLLPILPLLGLGWLLRNRAGATVTLRNHSLPFRVRVVKSTFIPVTPLECYEGYDTKVEFDLEGEGDEPAWWQTETNGWEIATSGVLKQGNKILLGRVSRVGPHRIDGQWKVAYALQLQKVPRSGEKITLRDRMLFPKITGPNRTWSSVCPTNLNQVVWTPGQEVKPPVVDRKSPLKLVKYEVSDGEGEVAFGETPYFARVRFWVRKPVELNSNINVRTQPYGPDGKPLCTGTYTEIDNPRQVNSIGSLDPGLQVFDHLVEVYPDRDQPVPRYEIATFSTGSSWPLEVKVPISDASGKLLLAPRTPSPLTLLSMKVRKATLEESSAFRSDTVVDVKCAVAKSFERTPNAAYVEDLTDGLLVECNGNLSIIASQLNGYDCGDVQVSRSLEDVSLKGIQTDAVTWSFQLKLKNNVCVPAKGKLTFKTAISMNNCKATPIFAVLRPS